VTARFYDGCVADPARLSSEHECHSWVMQMIQLLKYCFGGGWHSANVKDTGGTLRSSSIVPTQLFGWISQGALGSSGGPLVGTSTAAESALDYCLGARITHGTGSGQLSHGATSLTEPVVSGTTSYFKVARIFTNNSGGSITINEIAIYCTSSYTYCLARDKLSVGEVCAPLSSKTLEFTITVDNT